MSAPEFEYHYVETAHRLVQDVLDRWANTGWRVHTVHFEHYEKVLILLERPVR